MNVEGHQGVHGDWKAKDVGELLEVVSDKVPNLLTRLFKIVYSEESAKEMGKAVGSLYKELVAAGIPQETAVKMTSDYMFSLKELARVSNQHVHEHGHRGHRHGHHHGPGQGHYGDER